jgi:predicted small secreted protein
MNIFINLSLCATVFLLSACNTIGGLGHDVSEAGKALDKAAYWSQNQIETISDEVSSSSDNEAFSDTTPLSIEDANTARQY